MMPPVAQRLSRRHLTEIAAAETFGGLGRLEAAPRISPHITRSEGFAESAPVGPAGGVYGFFDSMEDKDPHLFSILQTRKHGVLARPRAVEPAGADRAGREIADWLEAALEGMAGWDDALMHLLGSLSQGMAVLEVIWGFDRTGRVAPAALKPRNAGRFALGPDGALRLLDSFGLPFGRIERNGSNGDRNRPSRTMRPLVGDRDGRLGEALPERKFIVMLFGANDERPYGRGLCERVFWLWWFKKVNLRFWVMHNEKFGAPTVVARHQPGLSPEERERLLEVISSLQADTGLAVPEGIEIDLLETGRRGGADTYRDLANWCNDQMSRAVLGQTLTVGEGQRGGSFALGKVHELVRFDYVRTDACRLMNAVNGQLVRWMIDFNFGEDHPAPRWRIDLRPEIDREIEAGIDRQLLQMGVPLPLRYFYEKYGRPAAGPGERALRYDDSNLFQYHLQFGVLTVNEVRASLGLPPVDWGDRPTSPVDAPETHPTPGASTGGALEDRIEKKSEEEREGEEEERKES